LVDKYNSIIVKLGRRANKANQLIKEMYSIPILSVKDISKILDIDFVPANKLVGALVDSGILRETTGYSRNRLFVLHEYLDLFLDKDK